MCVCSCAVLAHQNTLTLATTRLLFCIGMCSKCFSSRTILCSYGTSLQVLSRFANIHCQELMKSVASNGSQSLPFMMKMFIHTFYDVHNSVMSIFRVCAVCLYIALLHCRFTLGLSLSLSLSVHSLPYPIFSTWQFCVQDSSWSIQVTPGIGNYIVGIVQVI